jgi:hypothetical protein
LVTWSESFDYASFTSSGLLEIIEVESNLSGTISAQYEGATAIMDITIINYVVSPYVNFTIENCTIPAIAVEFDEYSLPFFKAESNVFWGLWEFSVSDDWVSIYYHPAIPPEYGQLYIRPTENYYGTELREGEAHFI